jgi:hypothetical protein
LPFNEIKTKTLKTRCSKAVARNTEAAPVTGRRSNPRRLVEALVMIAANNREQTWCDDFLQPNKPSRDVCGENLTAALRNRRKLAQTRKRRDVASVNKSRGGGGGMVVCR